MIGDRMSDADESNVEATAVDRLPSALEAGLDDLGGEQLAIFLDYDGTLTPIVSHPSQAVLSDDARQVLARLAERRPVAIISGRDRADVESLVGLDDIFYAGSHGFDISGPNGFRSEIGSEFRPALERAAATLEAEIAGIEGAWVERKRYAVAVHFRQAPPEAEEQIRQAVTSAVSENEDLRMSGGKKIFECRPRLDWDKGRALESVLSQMGLDEAGTTPIYIGDDETDEDAFAVLRERGIGIVVGISSRPSLARFSLADPGEVHQLLARLADR